MKKFWFMTLCVFLLFVAHFGLTVPLRIAIGTNAALILLNIANCIFRGKYGNTKEEN